METDKLNAFIACAVEQTGALDVFVEEQRAVSTAVRSRDWPVLEKALEAAAGAATLVSQAEQRRKTAWENLTLSLDLPSDASVFRVSLSLPLEQRPTLPDAYRALRLAAMRARIETEALSGFVGEAASTLRHTMEALYPERKGHIYGRSGRPNTAATSALILNTAF